MKEQPIDWTIPRRQSPSAVFIVMAKALLDILKFLWPVLLVFLFRSSDKRSNSWEIIVLIVPIISILAALIELYFFKFHIINRELIIRKGVLVKKTLVLPLEKIQAVHIDRTWLHNIFSSAQISFDSAGSEKMEIKISAIKFSMATALREHIEQTSDESNVEENRTKEEIILTLDMKDLAKLSISSNHLEAFFILLAFGLSVLDNIEKVTGGTGNGFWQQVIMFAMGSSGKMVMFLAVAILLVSITISTVRILLIYMDFRISSNENGFRIRTGLINVREKIVPFRKIQFISWRANWLRARMKLYLLKFHSVGADQMRDRIQIKVPVTRKEFIPILASSYHILPDTSTLKCLRIQQQYIFRRILMTGIIPSVIFCAIGYPLLGSACFWILVIIPLVWLHSFLFRKRFRLWANADVLQIRRTVFGEDELILKWRNIQRVRMQQSFYQRNNNLATIKIFTAGGAILVPYIKQEEATAIMNYALFKIESDNRVWM